MAEYGNHPVAPPLGGTEADEEDLVFGVVYDRREFGPSSGQVCGRELTFEDRKLEMVPVILHGLEHIAKAFVIRHVVADRPFAAKRLARFPPRPRRH